MDAETQSFLDRRAQVALSELRFDLSRLQGACKDANPYACYQCCRATNRFFWFQTRLPRAQREPGLAKWCKVNLDSRRMLDIHALGPNAKPPRLMQGNLLPQYPLDAQRLGVEGFVHVELLLSAEGIVLDVLVLDSHPLGVFEEVTVANVRRASYRPSEHVDRTLPTRWYESFAFCLNQRVPEQRSHVCRPAGRSPHWFIVTD